jgi:hypothetical protein
MFCSSCGKELMEGAKFCANCGVQVGAGLQPSQEATGKTSKLRAAGQAITRAANAAGSMVGTVATQIGDLNGDGKIDEEDLKIATARAKEFATAAADETVRLGKEALKSDMVKDAAAGAAVGAAVAIPVPIIGPAAGAVVGAGLGVYKNLTK